MTGESDPYDESFKDGPDYTTGNELARLKSLADDREEKLRYLQADFDNYRKQFDREKASLREHANENLIRDLLVILDDLDRAIPSLGNEQDRVGIGMIAKRLMRILSGYGLAPIESTGKKFDPRFHEVLCTEECDEEDGTILEELEKGYLLKSKVIRPAKVKIARQAAGSVGEQNG